MYDIREKALRRFEAGERKPLLTRGNPKTEKSVKKGYLTAILHLSPAQSISRKNLCPFASAGCLKACLNTAGRGADYMLKNGVQTVQRARALRTIWFEKDQASFLIQLEKEITTFVKYAKSKDLIPCIRLNGTSDILWERHDIIQKFPDVQFYDYRKAPVFSNIPKNYHLTFSRAEDNEDRVDKALEKGLNVAVVFNKLPKTWKGLPVIDGDETDLRFLDPKGCIVGLKAKGKAKQDTSGFVIISETIADNSVLQSRDRKLAAQSGFN